MPHNPRGRNERQDERNSRQESQNRRQNAGGTRNSGEEGMQRGRRTERTYRSTIMSSIDYDRNAE